MIPILKRYLDSLTRNGKGEARTSVAVANASTQIIGPLLVALLLVAVGFEISDGMGLITCASIVSAMMCAVSVLLFQIRTHEVREDQRLTSADYDFVGDLFSLSVWAMALGLVLAATLALPELLNTEYVPFVNDSSWLSLIIRKGHLFICYFLGVHLITVVLVFATRFVTTFERIAEKRAGNS